MVVYLDFDGVLHRSEVFLGPRRVPFCTGGHLFEYAPLLEQALAPHPAARLVLSTNWVPRIGFAKTCGYLPAALRRLVIGATYHSRLHGPTRELRQFWLALPRGLQVAGDVSRRAPAGWLALDDLHDEFSAEQQSHLIACDPALGLSTPGVLEQLSAALLRH